MYLTLGFFIIFILVGEENYGSRDYSLEILWYSSHVKDFSFEVRERERNLSKQTTMHAIYWTFKNITIGTAESEVIVKKNPITH